MRDFLEELGFIIPDPMSIREDNQSAIAIALNPVHHARIKHIEVKTHFIRENLDGAQVKLVYCPSELMIADILTKALPGRQHNYICEMMGLYPYPEADEKDIVRATFAKTFFR